MHGCIHSAERSPSGTLQSHFGEKEADGDGSRIGW
jgi:hypothetical protein